MQWTNASEFFAMGGYGVYVWGAYGVTFITLCLEVVVLRASTRRATKKVVLTQTGGSR